MRCNDFREIADSFLSDELLVETNHAALRHLEDCENCRKELETRKIFREKLRGAVFNAPESQINQAFAARLRSELKKDYIAEERRPSIWQNLFSLKFASATAALLFVAVTIGFVLLADRDQQNPPIASVPSNSVQTQNLNAAWEKISVQAVGDHQHCGLEKMNYWQNHSHDETPEKTDFRKNILQKISYKPDEPVQLLHVHDCIFDGRKFTHAVIRIGNRNVSVLLTETPSGSKTVENKTTDSAINSQMQQGFQVASFNGLSKAVFVISDMAESENLNLARSLSNAMNS